MVQRSFPFDALPVDAPAGDTAAMYEADWVRLMRLVAPPHVVGSAGSGAYDLSLSGSTATVSCRPDQTPAEAFIDGSFHQLVYSATDQGKWSSAIPSNTGSNPRIDRIVLRRDLVANRIRLTYLQGTPAASPVAPALTQTPGGTYDLPLHRFTVAAGAATATSPVDERFWRDPAAQKTAARVDVFTASGVFTPVAGATVVEVVCIGGGGGGTSGSSAGYGGGGGGARVRALIPVPALPASVPVSVGQGGAIGAAGGMSTFGTLVGAGGGTAGQASATAAGGVPAGWPRDAVGVAEGAGGTGGPAGSSATNSAPLGGGGGGGYGAAGGASGLLAGGSGSNPAGAGQSRSGSGLAGSGGGAGTSSSNLSGAGGIPGGGGGGTSSASSANAAAGGRGEVVIITYF